MQDVLALKREEARLRAILDAGVEAELRAIPGVVHVSVGLKQINGTATDEFCIRVYVAQKKDPAAIPPGEHIPRAFRGVPTDVNEVVTIEPQEDSAPHRPITGGIQITNGILNPAGLIPLGTLGCLATDNIDRKTVLVTGAHVLGERGPGDIGVVPVFQPTSAPAFLIGALKRGRATGTIDAAIADINPGIGTTDDEILGLSLSLSNKIAGVADPLPKMRVFKVGCTTGLTAGKIVDTDMAPVTMTFKPPIGPRTLTKLILIQCTRVSGCCCCTCDVVDSSQNFSANGDSGAAVVSEQRMAIGLIVGGIKEKGESFACRMTEVESLLNVTINRTVVVAGPHTLEGLPPPALVSAEDDTVWSTLQRRLDEMPFGREVAAQVRRHLPEALDLVNHHRAVMVTWQRVHGPSLLAQWMRGVRNPSLAVPREINGVATSSALLTLAAVLEEHGSAPLQQALGDYGLRLLTLLDHSATVDELMDNMGEPAPA